MFMKHLCPPPSLENIHKVNEQKLQIIRICLCPRGITLSINCLITSKIKLDLDIIMINLYTKFHFNLCNLCEENERQLLVNRPTDQQTERPTDRHTIPKQYALRSSKGGIIKLACSLYWYPILYLYKLSKN